MLGNPALYPQIEARLTELLGAPDTLLPPTLTHIHASVIPVLASDGTIFVDARAHKTVWDGCVAARAHGAATVVRYAHDDPRPWSGCRPAIPGRPGWSAWTASTR
jgi:8-amino-7-oxononanoate synthase